MPPTDCATKHWVATANQIYETRQGLFTCRADKNIKGKEKTKRCAKFIRRRRYYKKNIYIKKKTKTCLYKYKYPKNI